MKNKLSDKHIKRTRRTVAAVLSVAFCLSAVFSQSIFADSDSQGEIATEESSEILDEEPIAGADTQEETETEDVEIIQDGEITVETEIESNNAIQSIGLGDKNGIMLASDEVEEESTLSVTAVLYDNQNAAGDGVSLTEEGATVEGWTYREYKYLVITVKKERADTCYVEVSIPREAYVVNPSSGTDYTLVSTTALTDEIQINQTTYDQASVIKSRIGNDIANGTLQYEIGSSISELSFTLILCYDENLWDKAEGSEVLTGDPIAIKSYISGDENKAAELKLSSVKAGDALTSSFYPSYSTDDSTYETGSISATKKDEIYIKYSTTNTTTSSFYLYAKEATITISVPSCTVNGTTYYLDYDTNNISFSETDGVKTWEIDEKNTNESQIVIKVKNYWQTVGMVLKIKYTWNSEWSWAAEDTRYTFTGSLSMKNSSDTTMVEGSTYCVISTLTSATLSNAKGSSTQSVTLLDDTMSAVTLLQGWQLVETSAQFDAENPEITMEFSEFVLVTAVNLYADDETENIILTCTLVDENGDKVYAVKNEDGTYTRAEANADGATDEFEYSLSNSKYGTTTTANCYILFTTSKLPEGLNEYYLSSVSYSLSKIFKGTKQYATSAPSGTASGGNFFGYLKAGTKLGSYPEHTLTIKYGDEDNRKTFSSTAKTLVVSTNNPGYYISSSSFKNVSQVTAGNDITLTGTVAVANYPYGGNNVLQEILIGVILPSGVSVDSNGMTLKTSSGAVVSGEVARTATLSSGDTLYVIAVDKTVKIGYYSKTLGAINSGASLTFTMTLKTETWVEETVLQCSDVLRVASAVEGVTNSAAGAYAYGKTTDTYDLDNDGSTSDYIAKGNSTATCTIVASASDSEDEGGEGGSSGVGMNVSAALTLNESTGTSVYLSDEADELTYTLSISNTVGGTATGFEYYIPIASKTNTSDGDTYGLHTKEFVLALTEAAAAKSDNLNLKLLYATENMTVSGAEDYTNWIEESSVTDWSSVTMIKISCDETITNGQSAEVTINLKYEGDNFDEQAGMLTSWSSGGSYLYKIGTKSVNKTRASNTVKATIIWSYEDTASGLTLTAATAGSALSDGASNTARLLSGDESFPEFENAHSFSITGISLNGVTLISSSLFGDDGDYAASMSAADSNEKFAMTVSLGDGSAVDLAEAYSSISSGGLEVGSTEANESPVFTFTLYNGDALTDASTVRYLDITLTSDKNVTITVRINIARQLAVATASAPNISGGQIYTTTTQTVSSVEISQDSAFTAQFVTAYYTNNYQGDRTLSFSNAIPAGTTLLLIDFSNTSSLAYYSYKVAEDEITSLSLTDFAVCGDSETKYSYSDKSGTVTDVFLLIVDFSGCESYIAEDTTTTVTLKYTATESVSDSESELQFTVKSCRSTSLTATTSSAQVKETCSLSYSSTASAANESRYSGSKLALVVYAEDKSLPADATLEVNGNTYTQNAAGEFIIEVADLSGAASGTLSVSLTSETLTEDINLTCDLYISATANAKAPKLGDKVASSTLTYTVNTVVPSFKVEGMKVGNVSTRLISSLADSLSVQYSCKDLSSCSVSVELQQLVGSGYVTSSTLLSSVSPNMESSAGVFTLFENASNTSNASMSFSLNSVGLTNESYRLHFKILDENGSTIDTVDYGFIVYID